MKISSVVLFLAFLISQSDVINPWAAPHGEYALVGLRKKRTHTHTELIKKNI